MRVHEIKVLIFLQNTLLKLA